MKRLNNLKVLLVALPFALASCGGGQPAASSSSPVKSASEAPEESSHHHDSASEAAPSSDSHHEEESSTHEHEYGEWEHDETDHWRVCSICGEETEKEHHRGGESDCAHRAVCEVCGAEYGELDDHDYGPWINDPEHGDHYHVCSVCDGVERAEHVFDQEVVDPAYLVGEFNEGCEVTNTYYKSCICGAPSNDPNLAFTVETHHEYTLEIILDNDANLISPATCTEPAVYGYVCEHDRESFSTTKTFVYGEPTGHNYEVHEEAYTFSSHNIAYAYCDQCNQYFIDVREEGAEEPVYEIADPDDIFDDEHGQYGVEGFGTEEDPYIIATQKDLVAFRAAVNSSANHDSFEGKTIVLSEDIELDEETEFGDCIGNDDKRPFSGTFDGQGHTIANFRKTKNAAGTESAKDAVALFSRITGGTVKNLKLENVTITGTTQRIAGIVARAFDATIEQCEIVSGTITGGKQVGGIAGATFGTTTIKNCINRADILSSGVANGGIVGHAYSGDLRIESCTNYGTVSTTGEGSAGLGTGGIFGNTNAGAIASTLPNEHNPSVTIINCTNDGEIVSDGEATGGIAGQVGIIKDVTERDFLIKDCENNGNVTGASNGTGGILGSSGTAASFEVKIEGCHNTATIEGVAYVGGIVGLQRKNLATSEIKECTNDGDVGGTHSVGGIVGLTRANVLLCKTLSTASIRIGETSALAANLSATGSKNVGGYLVGVVENSSTVTGELYSETLE